MKNMVETEVLYRAAYEVTNGLTSYVKGGVTKDRVLAKLAEGNLKEPELPFETVKGWLVETYSKPHDYNEFELKVYNILFHRNDEGTDIVDTFIDTKDIGLAIYAFVGAKQNIERIEARKKEYSTFKDEFFGNVGDRVDVVLTLDKIVNFEEYSMFLYHDAENHLFRWPTENKGNQEVGKAYAVRGTIKAHNEYSGAKQTVINRCKVQAA